MYKFKIGRYISAEKFKSADAARRAAAKWVSTVVSTAIPISAISVFRV